MQQIHGYANMELQFIGYVDSNYAGDLDKCRSTMGYVFTLSQVLVSQLTLYSIVYWHIIYYGGRVYGHDGGYTGGNLASKIV